MMAYLAPSKRSWLTQGASTDPHFVLASHIQQAGLPSCIPDGRRPGKKTGIQNPQRSLHLRPAGKVQAVAMAAPFKVYLKSNVNTYLMLLVWPDQTVRDMAGVVLTVQCMQAAQSGAAKKELPNVEMPQKLHTFLGRHLATVVTSRKGCLMWECTGHPPMSQSFCWVRSTSSATFLLQPHCCLSALHMH